MLIKHYTVYYSSFDLLGKRYVRNYASDGPGISLAVAIRASLFVSANSFCSFQTCLFKSRLLAIIFLRSYNSKRIALLAVSPFCASSFLATITLSTWSQARFRAASISASRKATLIARYSKETVSSDATALNIHALIGS